MLLDFNGEYVGEQAVTENKKIYNLSTNRKQETEVDKKDIHLNIPEKRFLGQRHAFCSFGATEQTQQPF